jgi:hypothetical protein
MGRLIDIAAALLSVGAGLYLLQYGGETTSIAGESGTSWFEIIAHGMGIYFVAKGLWMARSLHLQKQQLDATRTLVELDAHEHVERTSAAPALDA